MIVGFIVIPTFIKASHEMRTLRNLYLEYRKETSDGGEKITFDELIELIRQSGVLFRQLARLFKSNQVID